jgi:hypothetical protein
LRRKISKISKSEISPLYLIVLFIRKLRDYIVNPSFVSYEATDVENSSAVDYQDHAGHRANVTRAAAADMPGAARR